MVLGSFQCYGILLLWHIVGQRPAVLATGTGQVGCCCFLSHLSYIPFIMPPLLGDGSTLLKYFALGRYNPKVFVTYFRVCAR